MYVSCAKRALGCRQFGIFVVLYILHTFLYKHVILLFVVIVGHTLSHASLLQQIHELVILKSICKQIGMDLFYADGLS